MEFSKEETNPLMFGYWGNKVFRNGFVTFVIPFILTLRKPNMIFSILFILTCHSGHLYKEASLSSKWMNIEIHQNLHNIDFKQQYRQY